MSIWLTILGMGLATYATRVLPLVTMRSAPGPRLERFLRYVPPAIFAALIVPALLAPEGQLRLGPSLWAGLIGAAVAYATRNMALTIIAGMASFALLRLFGLAG
jgi:branched-subunit amino acid transport protein